MGLPSFSEPSAAFGGALRWISATNSPSENSSSDETVSKTGSEGLLYQLYTYLVVRRQHVWVSYEAVLVLFNLESFVGLVFWTAVVVNDANTAT